MIMEVEPFSEHQGLQRIRLHAERQRLRARKPKRRGRVLRCRLQQRHLRWRGNRLPEAERAPVGGIDTMKPGSVSSTEPKERDVASGPPRVAHEGHASSTGGGTGAGRSKLVRGWPVGPVAP